MIIDWLQSCMFAVPRPSKLEVTIRNVPVRCTRMIQSGLERPMEDNPSHFDQHIYKFSAKYWALHRMRSRLDHDMYMVLSRLALKF